MVVIGISGKKQSGKSTVASIITELVPKTRIVNFADAVKEEVATLCKVSVSEIEAAKAFYRPLLQWWGTDFRRNKFGVNYWVNEWEKRRLSLIPHPDVVIAADVRFLNECLAIKDCGGYIIRVHRNIPSNDTHISETELDGVAFNKYVDNNGTIEQLREEVKKLL